MAGSVTAYAPASDAKAKPESGRSSAHDKRKLSKDEASAKVKEARECIEESYSFDKTNREDAASDLSFLAGNQWPDQVKREREAEGRPMLTINRLPQFVRQITNDIRQADIAIDTAPEDDQSDPKLSQIYDGLIRQIQYRSSAKHVYSQTGEHQTACGIGWMRVTTQYADDMAFEQEIRIKGIKNPLSVYCDPAAVEPDRSDAMWMAVTEMIPKKTFKKKWPKAADADVEVPSDGLDSRPFFWATEEAVRVAEYWYKVPVTRRLALFETGETVDVTDFNDFARQMLPPIKMERDCETHKVEMVLVSGAEVLDGPHEWAGKYIPLVPAIGGEFPLEHKTYRYGAIRFARDPQQLYNYYRTAHAELLALQPKAPYLVTTAMLDNPDIKERWDSSGKKNYPYLPYIPDPEVPASRPTREAPPQPSVAMIQEGQLAQDDMKATTGIYDTALGAKSNETSGIAIGKRQAESDVANYHFIDNLQRSLEHVGRILIDLIPKVYDNERVIRLMPDAGHDGEEEFVPINRVVYTEDGVPHVLNDLSAASFDIRVIIGKAYATKRMEAADSLAQFAQAMPPEIFPMIADLLAKNMDIPEADEMAKRLRRMVPQQVLHDPDDPDAPPPQPDPAQQAQQQAMQLEMQKAELEVQKGQGELAKIQAEIERADAQLQAQVQKGHADMALAQQKLQLEREKADLELAIKEQELELERQKLTLQREQADHQARLAEHSAALEVDKHRASEESDLRKFDLAKQSQADKAKAESVVR